MNPLDLPGTQFLAFYAVLFVIACVATGFIRRSAKRGLQTLPTHRPPTLDSYELAYLAGGAPRAVQAALVSLGNQGGVTIKADKTILIDAGTQPVGQIEAAIYQVASKSSVHFAWIVAKARSAALGLEDKLVGAGLLIAPGARRIAKLLIAASFLALLAIGISKIFVGVYRHKPVGFLIGACIVSFIAMLVCCGLPLRRTAAGDRIIEGYERKHAGLKKNPDDRQAEQLMLAVAIFGPTILAGTALADLRQPMLAAEAAAGGSGGSSCGGSSCGGSSCGGGGCGGCGGGD